MNHRRSTFVLYYLISAAVIAFLVRGTAPDSYRFIREGVEVQATIIDIACNSPNQLRYRFTVDGTGFEGFGNARSGNPPCEALKVGEPVMVYYLPSRPESNLPGNPHERFWTEVAGIAMAAVFIPLVLLLVIFLVIRKRSAKGVAPE